MSDFIVSARKYRPATFDSVVGQQHVSETLKNAIKSEHLAQAFLFTGPRGVGKTTCARILAKVLNCQNRTANIEPCDECASCVAFRNNASFNIHELDAASNNSVDHIRALLEQVRFAPQSGKYKIYIIDEVHMLSSSAFNAFLKTLEEPPSYAIFILATTEKHKIIPTILSRCQIFDFKRIQVADMMSHLGNIAVKEGVEIEEDALGVIAQKADGGLRDALSTFDRLVSFCGNKISYQSAIDNLNILDYDYYFRVVEAMVTENISQMLLLFDEVLAKGFDADLFVNGLADHLRNLLICKDKATLRLLEVSGSVKERFAKQAEMVSASLILTALDIANDCDINFKQARNKRLHVELALIRMCTIMRKVKALLSVNPNSEGEKKNLELKEEEEEYKKIVPIQPSAMTANAVPVQQERVVVKNLSKLVEEVMESEKTDKLVHEVDNAKVLSEWLRYASQSTSPSVKAALETAEIDLQGSVIETIVGLNTSKNTLLQESNLLPFLRKELGISRLSINITVDKSKAPIIEVPEAPRVLSLKERYEALKEFNPLVDDLIKTFGLSKVD